KVCLEPCIGQLELFNSDRQTVSSLYGVTRQGTADGMLYVVHDVKVEEAVEETNIERHHRIIRNEADRTWPRQLKIFDDDAGLDDVPVALHQHGELPQRPEPQPL